MRTLTYSEAVERYDEWFDMERPYTCPELPLTRLEPSEHLSKLIDGTWHLENVNGPIAAVCGDDVSPSIDDQCVAYMEERKFLAQLDAKHDTKVVPVSVESSKVAWDGKTIEVIVRLACQMALIDATGGNLHHEDTDTLGELRTVLDEAGLVYFDGKQWVNRLAEGGAQ